MTSGTAAPAARPECARPQPGELPGRAVPPAPAGPALGTGPRACGRLAAPRLRWASWGRTEVRDGLGCPQQLVPRATELPAQGVQRQSDGRVTEAGARQRAPDAVPGDGALRARAQGGPGPSRACPRRPVCELCWGRLPRKRGRTRKPGVPQQRPGASPTRRHGGPCGAAAKPWPAGTSCPGRSPVARDGPQRSCVTEIPEDRMGPRHPLPRTALVTQTRTAPRDPPSGPELGMLCSAGPREKQSRGRPPLSSNCDVPPEG